MALDWTRSHEAPEIQLDSIRLAYGDTTILHDVQAHTPCR